VLYDSGQGVSQHVSRAVHWYQEAAEQDKVEALGENPVKHQFSRGTVGVCPNSVPGQVRSMDKEAAIGEVVATFYAAPLKPELWAVALERLAKAIGVRQAALFDHGPERDRHKIFAFIGDPIVEGARAYEQHYWQFDEWTKRFPKHPAPDGLVCGEAIWPEASLRRSLFYNEFLLKYDVCQLAGVPSYAGPNEFNALSVYREPDRIPFDEEEYRILRLLAPHVNNAFAVRRRLTGLAARVIDLEAALDQVRVALIVLDRRGKPLMVNAAAKEICQERNGLLLSSNGLGATGIQESVDLKALIGRTVSNTGGNGMAQSGAMTIFKRNGRQLHVIITPIPPGTVDAPARATAILLISDPDRGRTSSEHVLRQLFSLTPAESRLALLLLTGITLPDAADRLTVSRETVRSQIKRIMQKTGARRQGELLKLLNEISALSC